MPFECVRPETSFGLSLEEFRRTVQPSLDSRVSCSPQQMARFNEPIATLKNEMSRLERLFSAFGSKKCQTPTTSRLRGSAMSRPPKCGSTSEMTGAEIVMRPGDVIDLLAPTGGEGLLPITIDSVEGGLQVHPHKQFDPDWHVRFKGKILRAGFPTILAEHE